MNNVGPSQRKREERSHIRILADQAFARAAGAPLVPGNSVRLLRDARENYPAWIEAIRSAERTVHFESYIIHEDEQGRQFAELLAAKAREGVRVRLIYDWMGALRTTSGRFWRQLRASGVEVRCFNPPRVDSPFGWLSRDHRKMIAVDGRVGFVTGLCVGRMWVGDPARGIEPWRDTGVEVRGPAVADIEQAFAQVWAATGEPLPPDELPARESIAPAGEVLLRVVASMPNTAGLYRLDQLIAAGARRTLWLTDAYYAGTTPYVQALRAAALDDVDVRLLVPQATDLPMVRALSRSGYRPLLEAGVRVFEWNGPMLHAKTAVADGQWARVGSSNLNLSSWIGNWELDVVVENREFGQEMEEQYLADLANSTEIHLNAERKLWREKRAGKRRLRAKIGGGSSGRAAAGAIRISNAVGAAITNHRILGPAEAQMMATAGLLLLALGIVAVIWPRWIAIPLGTLGIWTAISLFLRAYDLHRKGEQEERELLLARTQEARTPDGSESVAPGPEQISLPKQ
ncbi:MAG TPA: phospholipase D-like domain-containing protein [Blastocatellia bacterium]|nr:phospholipase D-like domain-containing protein [Blastocatellia bacterium]